MVDWFCSQRVPACCSVARSIALSGVSAWLLGWNAACPAQEPSSALITTVGEVRALGADEAEKQARPVRLKGVVTWVATRQDTFKIHDGENGVGVSLPAGEKCPDVGDAVIVEGKTRAFNVQTTRYPHVSGQTVTVTGRGSMPQPKAVSVAELVSFANYNQWVTVEGVVVMWMLKPPSLSVLITGPDTWAVVHVRGFDSQRFPEDWHGARIRVTGVNMGISHSQADTLISPGPEFLEVLSPGLKDPFALVETPAVTVARGEVGAPERVKVRGVVTATGPGPTLFLRSGEVGLGIALQHGWIRSAGEGRLYADAGPLQDYQPGDVVEVVGSRLDQAVESRMETWSLTACHARLAGQEEPPAPFKVDLATWDEGTMVFQWVELAGRLVQRDEFPLSRGLWRTTLVMESNGRKWTTSHQSRVRHGFSHLRLNDDVMLQGVVKPAHAVEAGVQLMLPHPGNAVSLGVSASARRQQALMLTALFVGAVALAAAWIATLHGSLRRQRQAEAALQALNRDLEQRVEERTEALKRAQEDIRKALDQERELGALKSRFVTMVSHEFRTPLGIIMSAVELIRHYEERLPEEQRRELQDDIHSAAKQMGELMEQVLVLGRVEAGRLGCRARPMDLEGLFGRIIDEGLSATQRKCPVRWIAESDLCGANADEGLLRHIFGNLIANAVKYSSAGSEVVVSARREGADAVIAVKDSGIGIPEEDVPHLFEAFYRCGNVGEIPGTGLGLVIVKRCTEIHGGTLELDSQVGKGTTFTVRLPVF